VPLTTSSADVFYLTTPEEVELDSDRPVTGTEMVEDLRARFEAMPAETLLDVDVTGDDAFGV
jgi:hypothetical protein